MLKDFVWKTFESTGDIDKYVFYKEIEEKSREKDKSKTEKEEAALSG